MRDRSKFSWLALVQGGFYLSVGLWSLLLPASFIAATGAPAFSTKQELWLAQSVEVLLIVVGLTLVTGGLRKLHSPEILLLGFSCSLGIAGIDFLAFAQGLVEKTYLYSGILQLALAILWIFAWKTTGHTKVEQVPSK